MAENEKLTPESQKERWIKYGANVALVTIVVILLAGFVTYLAQKTNRRLDTTASGAYSLKPQTINLIKDLKAKTKIVSLYQKPPQGQGEKMDYAQPVNDLLDEYRRKGSNIEVDAIDPVSNPSKVDDLITEVTNRYGGEVQKYQKVLNAYPAVYKQIEDIAAGEVQKTAALPIDKLGDDEDAQQRYAAVVTISKLPKQLQSSRETVERKRKSKPPDFKGAVSNIEDVMDLLSQTSGRIVEIFNAAKADPKVPAPIQQYMTGGVATYQQLKKLADDLLKQTKEVGELKLDDLRQSLRAKDAILVMGEKDMRVIPFEQVWPADTAELKQYAQGQAIKQKFAGEQQVTTAILALSQPKKTKLCFVRMGGPPVTTPGMFPFQRGGVMSAVAEQLRAYNFDVLEKDLTGMWAMQQQMQQQQMPTPPEPSDDQIKDAIWIVLNFPMTQQNPQMPTPPIGPKIAAHLKDGGSAMILYTLQSDGLPDTMKEWGIELFPNAIAVHPMIQAGEGRQADMMEDALRYPFVFDLKNYGDHLITRPVNSLASLFLPLCPLKLTKDAPAGVKVTPIIPLPTNPPTWGETDIDTMQNGEGLDKIKYDEAKDVGGTLYGGAVAEKDKGGRLVVIGSAMFAFDRWVNEPDQNLLRRGLVVKRYPANQELFCNSVYWLAKMDPLIAISPAAMEVARIEPIGDGALRAWRVGGLLIALPGLVVVAGAMVYFARRD